MPSDFVACRGDLGVHERTGATVLLRSHSNTAASRGRLTAPGVVDVTTHPDIINKDILDFIEGNVTSEAIAAKVAEPAVA